MTPTTRPRGRLAPSPTGGLHVGHARTFLVAWLAARSRGGQMLLRIEDIDSSRVRPGATAAAIADLQWLGLDWDFGPYAQSERTETYRLALEALKRQEYVYPCICTRADIERAASAPHAGEEGPVYPGACSGRSVADGERLHQTGKPFAWRFRSSQDAVEWNDLIKGPMSVQPAGDFILARSPFAPSYQLAVVVDDADMAVTQVIRGDDLVPSTPRQIQLYRALGAPPPEFGHVPLVHDESGRRLAKRDGAIKLAALRERGMSAAWLVGYLAKSCGWTKELEPSRPLDWIGRFHLDRIPGEPWELSPPEWPISSAAQNG